MGNTKSNKALRKLDFLIGTWRTQGRIIGKGKSGRISGKDTYTWVLDGAVMQHDAVVKMGGKPTKVLESIGYDAEAAVYMLRSFDQTGAFTTMQGRLAKKGVLWIWGTGMRATLTADRSGNSMSALWERSEDDWNWGPWMELTFKRVK